MSEHVNLVAESLVHVLSLGFDDAHVELLKVPGVVFGKTIGEGEKRVSFYNIGDVGITLYNVEGNLTLTYDNNKNGWSPCVPELVTQDGVILFSNSCASIIREVRETGALLGFWVHDPILQGHGCILDLSVDDGTTNLPTPDDGGDYFFMSCTLFLHEFATLSTAYEFESRDYPELPTGDD